MHTHLRLRFFKKRTTALVCALTIFIIISVLAPRSALYDRVLRFLWQSGHAHALVYVLNIYDADLAVAEGDYYFGGGAYDLERATAAYTQAIRLSPSISWAPYQLARISFVQGNVEDAFVRIEQERVLHPNNVRALYIRGLINISRGDLLSSEKDFKAFIASGQSSWGGYNDLSFVLSKEGKFEESKKVILTAMEKIPGAERNPWLLNSLGITYLSLKEYTNAQSAFARALPLAQQVTEEQWHRAYSGNDPAANMQSIQAFINAVQHNLLAAQAHIQK